VSAKFAGTGFDPRGVLKNRDDVLNIAGRRVERALASNENESV
jgi:hypothetical protein